LKTDVITSVNISRSAVEEQLLVLYHWHNRTWT